MKLLRRLTLKACSLGWWLKGYFLGSSFKFCEILLKDGVACTRLAIEFSNSTSLVASSDTKVGTWFNTKEFACCNHGTDFEIYRRNSSSWQSPICNCSGMHLGSSKQNSLRNKLEAISLDRPHNGDHIFSTYNLMNDLKTKTHEKMVLSPHPNKKGWPTLINVEKKWRAPPFHNQKPMYKKKVA